MEVGKDGGKRSEHKVVRWITGYNFLPEDGGLLDQPAWTIDMFESFKAGENKAASEILAK